MPPKRINQFVKKLASRFLGIEIRRINTQFDNKIYKSTKKWNYKIFDKYWVGGRFKVSNFSNGYHGILKQWWEHYNKGNLCLLISENNKVKKEFHDLYPNWHFFTLDYYDNKGESVDIKMNICSEMSMNVNKNFDLIICQATLEHLYDPFKAMQNIISLLKNDGVVVLHTHLPGYYYHPYPRDYIRYHPDWFLDIPEYTGNCQLIELYTTNFHIFAAYRRVTQISYQNDTH